MKNTLSYKGYLGTVNFDSEDRIFHGRVIGISDVIGFEGDTVNELESDFQNGVDDYIETCRDIGKIPETPFSDKIVLDMPPDLYAAVARQASQNQKPIDAWIIDVCRKVADA